MAEKRTEYMTKRSVILGTTSDGRLILRHVFNPIVFENEEGERIEVKMVDGGFHVKRSLGTTIHEEVTEDAL